MPKVPTTGSGTDDPDYHAIPVPENKHPEDYEYPERRAEILKAILKKGNPWSISRTKYAKRYDVAVSTITRDIQALREYIDDRIGLDAKLTARAVYEKTVQELQDDDEHKAAFDCAMRWNEFLMEAGEMNRAPRRVDAHVRHEEVDETDEYVVIRDDDDGGLGSNGELPPIDVESNAETPRNEREGTENQSQGDGSNTTPSNEEAESDDAGGVESDAGDGDDPGDSGGDGGRP